MKTLTITVPVQASNWYLTDAQLNTVRNFLSAFNGKLVSVTWAKPKSQRSLKQNAYYWGVVLTMIATDTGNSVMDLHDAYKQLYITPKFVKIGATEVQVPRTTTDLTPAEFNLYIEQVVAHAGQELGIVIPLPDGGQR